MSQAPGIDLFTPEGFSRESARRYPSLLLRVAGASLPSCCSCRFIWRREIFGL